MRTFCTKCGAHQEVPAYFKKLRCAYCGYSLDGVGRMFDRVLGKKEPTGSTCPTCQGAGVIKENGSMCRNCRGSGKVWS